MKRSIISANLRSSTEISVIYFIDNIDINNISFYLLDKNKNRINLEKSGRSNNNIAYFTLKSPTKLTLGNDYALCTNEGDREYIDYDDYVTTKEFNEEYTYEENDLGSTYSKKQTIFKVYSPLASKMMLKIQKDKNSFIAFEMKRGERGVFATTVKGDLINRKYAYVATINGRDRQFRDPYGKSVSVNSLYSAVVDLNVVKKIGTVNPKREITGLKDKVIYEVSIRDFVGNLVDRATYSSFMNKVAYLSFLGVSYIQLQPVLDFDNVDDIKVDRYNWGYDPLSFFALEGSYSEHPEDPHSRMIEFKKLVNELHRAGIRVIVDVVYNHVYDHPTSDFEKSFPGYYFRKNNNNKVCNGSGCGNDFASERPMARKLIIESMKFLVETYDIDGFRFDLLGLIDIDTTKKFVEEITAIKKDIVLYGEGWDMCTNLDWDKKTSMNNAKMVPEVGFFNAGFRDLIKGETFDTKAKGYVSGNLDKKSAVENAVMGSFLSDNLVDASQTINYVECHDNQTLFDKLEAIHSNEAKSLRKVKLANALTVLSLGCPLIHMGQEIGQSKQGLDNTYNINRVNFMDWKLIDERYAMVKYLSDLITLRNKYDIFNLKTSAEIANTFDIYQHPNGLMSITVKNEKYKYGYKEIIAVINPTDKDLSLDLGDYYQVFFNTSGFVEQEMFVQNVIASNSSFRILIKK